MKIALVSQEYPPETAKGGIGTQTAVKAKGLSALGHEVFVVSRSLSADRTELLDGQLRVIRIPGFEDHLPEMTDIVQWISWSSLVAVELERLDSTVGLDLIDFAEWAAEGFVYLLNRLPWKGVPVVIQLHGPLVMIGQTLNWPDLNSPFYKTGLHMEATCVQLADAVYSSSNCSTQWIRDWYDPGKERIPTIHLGIDTEKFTPFPGPKNARPTIIFAGKLVRNKGIAELVAAAVRLVEEFPDLCLQILGRGEQQLIEELHATAARSGATGLLEFMGFVHKEDLPAVLSRAHVFAAPSYYEGGPGFVYLEAMACGLPVIGCSGSGVDEIVSPGENGLLVPPRDVVALETALRRILSDHFARERMGVRAREFVVQHASSRDWLKKLEAFYQSIVQAGLAKKEA